MNDKPQRKSDHVTKGGHRKGECTSAMQKCIRRGLELEAVYFAMELAQSGSADYMWKRLCVIAHEDIGLADPQAVAVVAACAANFARGAGDLAISNAVLQLCRAKKSRECDDVLAVIRALKKGQVPGQRPPAMPDFALDEHTDRGRKLGRGNDYWTRESSRVWPPVQGHYGTPQEPALPRWTRVFLGIDGFDVGEIGRLYLEPPVSEGLGGDYAPTEQAQMFGSGTAPDSAETEGDGTVPF